MWPCCAFFVLLYVHVIMLIGVESRDCPYGHLSFCLRSIKVTSAAPAAGRRLWWIYHPPVRTCSMFPDESRVTARCLHVEPFIVAHFQETRSSQSVSQSTDTLYLEPLKLHHTQQHLQNLDFFYVSKLYFLTFFIAGRIINVSTIKSKYVTAASIFGIDSPFVAGLYIWNLWCVLKTCIKSGQVSFLFFFFFLF